MIVCERGERDLREKRTDLGGHLDSGGVGGVGAVVRGEL